jgi:hypothetical protein
VHVVSCGSAEKKGKKARVKCVARLRVMDIDEADLQQLFATQPHQAGGAGEPELFTKTALATFRVGHQDVTTNGNEGFKGGAV